MKMVIIDSGVSSEIAQKIAYFNGMSFQKREDEIVLGYNYEDIIGHGSSICSVILSHVKNMEIDVIKVTTEEDNLVDCDMLVKALDYIEKNLNADIINLSICVCATNYKDEMYQICRKLYDKGIVLVAAFDNEGAVSYPAAFDCVVGVTTSSLIINNNDYCPVHNRFVNVCAKGRAQRVSGLNGEMSIKMGDSLACAHFSGILAQACIDQRIKPMEALKVLGVEMILADSIKKNRDENALDIVKKYKKVAIFPYNKEMHSLVRYASLLPFQIEDIYDIRRSGRVGKKLDFVDTTGERNLIIKNMDQVNLDSVDTLIIGHTGELSVLDKSLQTLNFIREALEQGKNVYSLDSYEENDLIPYKEQGMFFSPKIQFDTECIVPFGKLFKNNVPVLGIFGTRSKQGKWSLQMELRKRFLADGYIVGQLGTEPTAYLFGLDSCYHFGYNGNRELTETERLSHINALIQKIADKNVDIIISGSQSQTITSNISNIDGYALDQYVFLQALQPDAVILAVCYEDNEKYVKDTIDFIEACTDCMVIGLMLFPEKDIVQVYGQDHRISAEEFWEFRNRMLGYLDREIEIYRLENSKEMDALYERTISYFGE